MMRRLGTVLAGLAVGVGVFVAIEVAYERTDAFRRGNRLYYRDGRATRPGIAFARFWTAPSRVGLTPPMVVVVAVA
jgi:hypothetical protein